MRDFTTVFRDRATFLPALQDAFHQFPVRDPATVRGGALPKFMSTPADLDFLAGDKHFRYGGVLISAGQYANGRLPHGIARKRTGVTIMADSGGYQLATGVIPWRGDESRELALNFAESYADIAPILDIPTAAISDTGVFNSFAMALRETVSSARFASERRKNVRLLGVLQGRTRDEADEWDDQMMSYPFEGWAFGGDLRLDMFETARRICRLLSASLIGGERNRIHVFGTGTLAMAVMLTALQQALREHLCTDDFHITYDCSSPSQMMKFGKAYIGANFKKFSFSSAPVPAHYTNVGSSSHFPLPHSAVGRLLTVGDLCVSDEAGKTTAWDGVSEALIVHHNIEVMLAAFDEANCRLEQRQADAERLAPIDLVRAYRGLRDMFRDPKRFPDPMDRLRLVERELRGAAVSRKGRLALVASPEEVEQR